MIVRYDSAVYTRWLDIPGEEVVVHTRRLLELLDELPLHFAESFRPPRPNEVSVTRISQEAETQRRKDQIRLELLGTLRRALPRDVTDHILKSVIHSIRVPACPDKLVVADPVIKGVPKSYPVRSQRQPRAIALRKHKGR